MSFVATQSFGNPFLVCDPAAPSDNVDLYQLELNGQPTADLAPDPTGQFGLKFDLVGLADGSYTARVRAHNSWGWSNFSPPFVFNKALPGVPTGIGLFSE